MFVAFSKVAGHVSDLAVKAKLDFKNMLTDWGYGEKVVDALWLWYDFSEKKGVASF